MPGAKGWIEVNEKYCKGCELCLSVCPPEVMELDMTVWLPQATTPRTRSRTVARGVLFVPWSVPTRRSPSIAKSQKRLCLQQYDIVGRSMLRPYVFYGEIFMTRELWEGNQAIAEAAVSCRALRLISVYRSLHKPKSWNIFHAACPARTAASAMAWLPSHNSRVINISP